MVGHKRSSRQCVHSSIFSTSIYSTPFLFFLHYSSHYSLTHGDCHDFMLSVYAENVDALFTEGVQRESSTHRDIGTGASMPTAAWYLRYSGYFAAVMDSVSLVDP